VPPASDADVVLQVKLWLLGISPMVWRSLLVPAGYSLSKLHGVFQAAMAGKESTYISFPPPPSCLRQPGSGRYPRRGVGDGGEFGGASGGRGAISGVRCHGPRSRGAGVAPAQAGRLRDLARGTSAVMCPAHNAADDRWPRWVSPSRPPNTDAASLGPCPKRGFLFVGSTGCHLLRLPFCSSAVTNG
jgi:hypothetical protein